MLRHLFPTRHGCFSKGTSQVRHNQALPADFRTLVTSRPHLSVGSQFPECKTVVIRAVDEDVRRYLEGRMSVLGKCVRLNVKLQKEIADSIARTVDGM